MLYKGVGTQEEHAFLTVVPTDEIGRGAVLTFDSKDEGASVGFADTVPPHHDAIAHGSVHRHHLLRSVRGGMGLVMDVRFTQVLLNRILMRFMVVVYGGRL